MMMRIWFAVAIFTLLGCNEPMAAISEIDKFRIMAIQVDPPEIRPGESTTHRVLYADPKGEGRSITFLWLTCLGQMKPTDDLSQGCEILSFQPGSSETGGDVYAVAPVPENILDDLPKDETFATATTILSACAGGEMPTEADFAALEGLENLDSLCRGGEHVLAFKSFRISDVTDDNRNTNPEIQNVKFNANTLFDTTDPDAGVGFFKCQDSMSKCLEGADIDARLTKSSFETYEQIELGDVILEDEAPYISWFADGGEFSVDRSRTATPPGPFSTKWSPPLDGGRFTLWVVAHDLRGGTSWKSYAIRAKTPLQK